MVALFLGMPILFIEKLFKIKKLWGKIVGSIILVSLAGLSIYASLSVGAIMGEKVSNQWAITYFSSFVTDFSLVAPLF